MKLVVIGGVAAGMSAASKAKRTNKDLEVKAFEATGYVSYGACGLPYFVQGLVKTADDLVARTPEKFAKQGIGAFVHHRVLEIDHENRKVKVADLQNKREFWEPYDYLMISTGASSIRLPVDGADLDGVFTVKVVEDGIAIRKALEEGPKKAVIVGGGYIGLEMSEALRERGLDVTVVELQDRLMPNMDVMLSEVALNTLQEHGVKVLLSTKVQGFEGNGRVKKVVTTNGVLDADIVIMAVGVRPNTELAKSIGVQVGPTGAIAVNERMETNVEGVYAAGDVAESLDMITKKPVYLPLGDIANKHGKVAGTNIGGANAVFKGVVRTTIAKVFNRALASTGLSTELARKEGFDVQEVSINSSNRAHYMPGRGPFSVKLVWEKGSGRLLGAQIAGNGDDALRIDAIAALILKNGTIEDLRALDMAYAPPFSPVWDPVLVAANVARF